MYIKDGDNKAREIQTTLEDRHGYLPEAFQAMGRNGDFLEAILQLNQAAGKNLVPKTRELVYVAVCAVNGCGYCLDAHRAKALESGPTEEEITGAPELAAAASAVNDFIKSSGLHRDITG